MAELKKTTRGQDPSGVIAPTGIFAPIGGHDNDNEVLRLLGDDFNPHDLNVAVGRPGELTVSTTQFIPAEIQAPAPEAKSTAHAPTEQPTPKRISGLDNI